MNFCEFFRQGGWPAGAGRLVFEQLAEAAGVKQSAIARLESLKSTPQIDTLFRVLTPMGYKLAIVSDDTV